jgi:hypothetical protein
MKFIYIYFVSFFFTIIYCQSEYIVNEKNGFKTIEIDYDMVKGEVIKNAIFFRMYLLAKNQRKKEVKIISRSNYLVFPGFGYSLYDLDVELKKSPYKYPDKDWVVFEVSFPLNGNNKKLLSWWGKEMMAFFMQRVLIAVNDKSEIKFISGGYFFKNPIAQDFELEKTGMDNYIDFVKFKLFNFDYDSIFIQRKEGRNIIFHAEKKECEGVFIKKEYTLNLDDPDGPLRGVLIPSENENIYCPYETFIPDQFVFENFDVKQRFLLDALTRNMYLNYTIDHLDEILIDLEYDSSRQLILKNNFDNLPNCDEFLGQFKLDKKVVCWDDKESLIVFGNSKYKFEMPLLHVENGHKVVYGFGKASRKFEVYGFYRKDKPILFQIEDNDLTKIQGQRYDPMLTNKEKGKIDVVEELKEPYLDWIQACPEEHDDLLNYFNEEMKFYLLAIDVKTNQIYFLSGEDILLSKSTDLYGYSNRNGLIEPDFSKRNLINKLSYIKDRLYSFQVKKIDESQVILNSPSQLVIQTKGYKDKQQINIKATLNYDNPEELLIDY